MFFQAPTIQVEPESKVSLDDSLDLAVEHELRNATSSPNLASEPLSLQASAAISRSTNDILGAGTNERGIDVHFDNGKLSYHSVLSAI